MEAGSFQPEEKGRRWWWADQDDHMTCPVLEGDFRLLSQSLKHEVPHFISIPTAPPQGNLGHAMKGPLTHLMAPDSLHTLLHS